MNKPIERLVNGIYKENPTFVLMLGMCPTLAVTTSAVNGIGMGLSTTAVLALSNLIISALRKIIPDRVRMPAYIVIVASLVTVVQMLLQGYAPAINDALGIYIPLIVVNCIILGRAESYASKNPVIPSFFDGLGMGLGFTCSITAIGLVREFLGAGQLFKMQVLPLADTGKIGYTPITIFVLAPGAFFILSILVAVMNVVRKKADAKGKPLPPAQGCVFTGDCKSCSLQDQCHGMTPATVEFTEAEKAKAEKMKAALEAKARAKAEAEAKAKAEAEAKDEAETETKTEAKAETGVKTETKSVSETEAKAETEAKDESKSEPVSETEAKAETEPEPEAEDKDQTLARED
ncbi:electron transport complex, RnfABCDGE type, E subunit [Shuttleworthella satelles DSM 14600]|uniref:Ion-translocating oxidoreductase complex subunit E n=1 Tax=Shuttleworthella satelles DSM 14600 TaxID=626523 RepID=C4GBC4_9FIRM|nr:electron transport complex subunit E [Shuttleworthia satelles]EEP28417.1 electron transport complex, RnfABCDGE type, E subunit [Shuttleworthia satelles DSM 14600]